MSDRTKLALDDLRVEYPLSRLASDDLEPDPLRQARAWLDEAIASGLPEPNAMTLATVDAAGRPSARIVLLKELDSGGLLFSTNYGSRKASELAANPHAAFVFHWQPLHRQLRVEGTVERATAEESDRIFAKRPRGARIGAWASPQSSVLVNREALDERVREFEARFPGDEVPRPDGWGAFRLTPERFEFWSGCPNRLHDRLCYVREGRQWRIERLAP